MDSYFVIIFVSLYMYMPTVIKTIMNVLYEPEVYDSFSQQLLVYH